MNIIDKGVLNEIVLEHFPVFIFWKDKESRFLGCNSRFANAAGFKNPGDLIGKTDFDMPWTEDEAKRYRQIDFEVMQSGESRINFEEEHTNSNGKTIWVRTSKIPLKNDRGEVFGILGQYEDITEKKNLELDIIAKSEKLEALNKTLGSINKELEQKNFELEEFAYITSHDLQEPLRTILALSSRLNESDSLDAQQKVITQYVNNSTRRLSLLVKNLMEHMLLGKKDELVEVDANLLIEDILQDLKTAINDKGAKISVEALPIIKVFRTGFSQLVQNLIANSIKFCHPERVPDIKICVEELPGHYKFSISDNGIGIDPKFHEKIFRVFQRLHSSNAFEGTGIGLANCKKIVSLHHGEISVDSKEGEGSTFNFTIKKM